jgi:hypothetical protein
MWAPFGRLAQFEFPAWMSIMGGRMFEHQRGRKLGTIPMDVIEADIEQFLNDHWDYCRERERTTVSALDAHERCCGEN